MRLFKTKEFARLMRAGHISDLALCEAVARAEEGLIDAQLGKFLIKQRVAREGAGKSGGFRAILFYRQASRAVFLYVFAKNEKANLTRTDEDAYRDFSKELATLGDETIAALVNDKRWIEIDYESYQREISERAITLPPSGGKGPARGRRH